MRVYGSGKNPQKEREKYPSKIRYIDLELVSQSANRRHKFRFDVHSVNVEKEVEWYLDQLSTNGRMVYREGDTKIGKKS